MMVPVAFPVGGNVHQQRLAAVRGNSLQESVGETLTVGQQTLECHRLRNGAVVKEQGDGSSRRQPRQVGRHGVNVAAVDIQPLAAVYPFYPFGLVRRQDRKKNAVLGQDVQRFQVHGGFRQPHALGPALEPMLEIIDPPEDLRAFVPRVGQRQDHVVVSLGQGRAVSGETLPALAVGGQNGLIDVGAELRSSQDSRVGPKLKLILA